MITFPHVEDYIELLAGYDPTNSAVLFNNSNYKFNLARYDVQVIQNMGITTLWEHKALTDKQSELAVKLILKYRRQFAKYDIDITPVENPKYRIPVRVVDRSRRIWIEDNQIFLKFPYNRQMIDELQEYKKISQGSMLWNHQEKLWQLGVTEGNVNWAVTWGDINKFFVDIKLLNLYEKVLEVETIPYAIKLIQSTDGYVIENAAPSLVEYVETNLGGFGIDNVIKLIDYAGILGYTIDKSVVRPPILDLFGSERNLHISPANGCRSLDMVFDYAELTQRYPIFIYDPSQRNIDISDRFSEDEIVRFNAGGKTSSTNYNIHTVKIIYAHKIPPTWNTPIPLLISCIQLMLGNKQSECVQLAEKVVYYCESLLKEI